MKLNLKLALITSALMASGLSTSVYAQQNAQLLGYTDGADVIVVKPVNKKLEQTTGIVYSQIKQPMQYRKLEMSVIRQKDNDLKPAIIYFPGGGFISANHDKYLQMRIKLAESGFVVASAEYRTVPDVFPAQLEDGKAAVRYLRAHAKAFGIDPKRIGVLGDSAGGYMSQIVATTNGEKKYDVGDFMKYSSDVQAAVTIYGISNLANIGEGFPAKIQKVHASPSVTEALVVNGPAFDQFPGASVFDTPRKTRNASPIGHVNGNEPPFLIMHGSADTLVSPEQSVQLYKALKAKGEDAQYVLVKGAGHGDIHWYQPKIINKVVSFFQDKLGKPIKNATIKASFGSNL